ncbi:sensor histidine kinase [Bacillus niameyensis]|uniref:sensor histidine kinase n=1 Tax=Bacillus niameyensis TaxID=1522308 RepID=UPI0007853144|nr:HAMP domain-containing sensor histidine kinase [Bacillus niameyensis]
MATKWKSSFIMLIWSISLTIGLTGIYILFSFGKEYIYWDYFKTPSFQEEVDQFAYFLYISNMNNLDREVVLTVTDEDIKEYRARYGDIDEEVKNIKKEYNARLNQLQHTKQNIIIAERDKKIEDMEKIFTSDDFVSEKIVGEREEMIEDLQRKLENASQEFHYFFTNPQTKEVYSNLPHESQETEMTSEKMQYITDYTIYGIEQFHHQVSDQERIFQINNQEGWYEGKIAVPKSLSASSPIMKAYSDYRQSQLIIWIFVVLSIISLIFCFRYTKELAGLTNGKAVFFYNKLPIDVRGGFFLFTAVCGGLFIVKCANELPTQGMGAWIALTMAVIPVGLTAAQGILLFRERSGWKKAAQNSMLKRAVYILQEAFLNRKTGTQLFLILGLVFVLGAGIITIFIHPVAWGIYFVAAVVIGFPLVVMLVKKAGYFNRILEESATLNGDIPVIGQSVLAALANNLNGLIESVKKSESEQIKSERLKTELITNVSHDLRTPLTSIITYTDLLKQGELSEDERNAYLDILDRKSKRLKVLIDDLFEVSKMASGNVELHLTKVDLVQLLQQALGEYDDKIEESNLQFRITQPETPIYAMVDGQKIWRVFENLIGNILKYSLEHSRVYISVSKSDSKGVIIFKNVSKYELNDNEAELFERFKRGDKSRHTDGAGLGLAIAKSIVELHHGVLEIETDGDLFKVIVKLKLE